MNRPHVQIKADNQVGALRQHLETMLPMLKALPGVVGLTLNGGLSRGYADHLSEIDVTIYLRPGTFRAWQSGKTPLPVGITKLQGALYDVKFVDFEAEKARDWDNVALWDASYAEILHDPQQALNKLFAEKLAQLPQLDEAEGLLMSCWWYWRLAGDIWIHRGDVLQGHHMFNQAVIALVQALFIANREYVPHEKWLLHLSRSLSWKPADWEKRLGQAMNTGDQTLDSLRQRQAVIEALWSEVDAFIIECYYPDLPVHVMQKTVYDWLKTLVDKGSMSIAEWKAETGTDVPNGDPFYDVLRVEGDRLELDREKLLQIRPEDMYAWHYAVLRAVRLSKYTCREKGEPDK